MMTSTERAQKFIDEVIAHDEKVGDITKADNLVDQNWHPFHYEPAPLIAKLIDEAVAEDRQSGSADDYHAARTALKACKEINPEYPLAVAESLPELWQLVKDWLPIMEAEAEKRLERMGEDLDPEDAGFTSSYWTEMPGLVSRIQAIIDKATKNEEAPKAINLLTKSWQEPLKRYHENEAGNAVLYDARESLKTALCVGIYKDQGYPQIPYCAITVHAARWFRKPVQAAKWFADVTNLPFNDIIAAIQKAEELIESSK